MSLLDPLPVEEIPRTMLLQHSWHNKSHLCQNFSEDVPDVEGESFPDWKEQFKLVAEACCWTDQSKLVNLITRLRGQAYSYYRSCTPEQRSSYPLLVKALEERFTPVRIQAVQSSRLHERKQSSLHGQH